MTLRDFLILIKVGTNFSITKQFKIYKMLKNVSFIKDNEWTNYCSELDSEDIEMIKKIMNSKHVQNQVKINQKNSKIITILDQIYPKTLREIYCPPIVLFCHGDLKLLACNQSISLVGARQMTEYGEKVLQCLIPLLVKENIITVSGLAAGVDATVHQLTNAAKGKTIAVIGNGLDLCYPKKNSLLKNDIAVFGLVISEYPMGAKPLKFHFVERNRIIAGINYLTCVIEAQQHSGSLITANFALSENRTVLAVPGSIFNPYSTGTNQIIAAGAKPLLQVKDVLEELCTLPK